MTSLYNALVYNPLYNVLVFLISAFPALNVGWVIIIFTVFVKLLLFPLSRATIKNQIKMKKLEPKMAELRTKFKGNQQQLSVEMMNLYKTEKTNPFAGIFLVLIQLPILFALYRVFWAGGLPVIHTDLLYSFVTAPLLAVVPFDAR
jgi:YidC/Oxa1 family membrane protein insertase